MAHTRNNLLRLDTLPHGRAVDITASPASFDGNLDDLVRSYILPNLPRPDAVERFHRQLVAYCRQQTPLFLVRRVGETERGREYITSGGDRFRATDNSPAWAVHYALFHEVDVPGDAFARFIEGLPVHMFETSRVLGTSISTAGWHVAHIYAVGDRDTDFRHWSHVNVIRRFVRNIHPCNYFFVPLANWRQAGSDERLIAYFAHLYAERYAAVWPEFLALAQGATIPYQGVLGQLRYAYGASGAAPERIGAEPSRMPARAPQAASPPTTRGQPLVTYRHTRLCFKADQIEPLPMNGSFRVTTNVGTFQMTKAEFYRDFGNVVQTRSYRTPGGYHYPVLPRAAERYRVP
jgi:hypothetical protein